MDETTKQKIKEIAPKLIKDENIAVYLKLEEIADSLAKIASKEMPEMHMETPETQKIEIAGAEVITIKGEKGDTPKVGIDFEQPKNGEDYILTEQDKKEIASKIKVPIVERVIEKTEVVKEQPIITNEIKEVAMKDTAYETRDKLESIDNEDEKLKIEAIQNLREELDDLKKKWASRPMFGGMGGLNLSGLNLHILDWTEIGTGDDATTEFSLTQRPSPISSLEVKVAGGDMFEGATEDFTYSATTNKITFLTAPSNGAKIRYKCRI